MSLPLSNFLTVLYQTRFFLSTELRDKLYGLIGLVSSAEFQIIPHYEWPRREVYIDLVRALLAGTGKLQILSLAGMSTIEPGHSCTLPSWVPHLDCGITAPAVPFKGFKAADESMAEASISQDFASLQLKGSYMGVSRWFTASVSNRIQSIQMAEFPFPMARKGTTSRLLSKTLGSA
ncbi:hypothetical protein V8E51_018611 [Hyaloscypha variabilis]